MDLSAASIEPVHHGNALGRIGAGAMGGLLGGLLFGVLMLGTFVAGDRNLAGGGVLPLVMELLGTTSPLPVWVSHATVSVLSGVAFALVVSTRSWRNCILWGLTYAVLLWIGGAMILLRTLTGEPIALDAAALTSLVGHLLYGVGLGVGYPGFMLLEIDTAADAETPRIRQWGRDRARLRPR